MQDMITEIKHWKKVADDWRKTAHSLAFELGNTDRAVDVYEEIRTSNDGAGDADTDEWNNPF